MLTLLHSEAGKEFDFKHSKVEVLMSSGQLNTDLELKRKIKAAFEFDNQIGKAMGVTAKEKVETEKRKGLKANSGDHDLLRNM